MLLDKIVLRRMKMALKSPFETSFGVMREKHFILAELHAGGLVGYGDCAAFDSPWYTEETTATGWHMLEDFLVPMVLGHGPIARPADLERPFARIRGNNMAKSALDCALWDLYAKRQGIPLARILGGVRSRVEAGVSIGLQESPEALAEVVGRALAEGYRRVKVKIKPGKDLAYLTAVRRQFGDILLMADANSAYSLADIDLFREMDRLDLLMIEQPLAHDDIVDHARLQAAIRTRICLDESIHSAEDARKAIELGSARTINVKIARLGGLTEAKKVHDVCAAAGVPVWCGGMLDSGLARAHSIAVASLPNFLFPGDLPGSDRLWDQDLIAPPITIADDGMIEVPEKPGIGYDPVPELIERFTVHAKEFARPPVTARSTKG